MLRQRWELELATNQLSTLKEIKFSQEYQSCGVPPCTRNMISLTLAWGSKPNLNQSWTAETKKWEKCRLSDFWVGFCFFCPSALLPIYKKLSDGTHTDFSQHKSHVDFEFRWVSNTFISRLKSTQSVLLFIAPGESGTPLFLSLQFR